ncbi:MAG: metal ABC transporter ATP-binding protein [Planctomycetota bacterium]
MPLTPATHAVHLRDLSVAATGREILRLDELTVPHGEVLSVLGPNGAGKTTLLKCCLGLIRPSRGTVTVLGEQADRLRPAALSRLRRRIGYVPQLLAGRSELPLTVREVVAIGRTGLRGLGRRLHRQDWRVVDAWVERLGLAELSGAGYGELSGGEQRKALIAKAMAQEPEILALDEPTANLDLYWREQIVSLLDALYDQTHVTVLLVCHDLEVIPRSARRALVLADGRVLACGTPRAVLDARTTRTLYGASLCVVERNGRFAAVPLAGPRACQPRTEHSSP